ncbi:MAG TPA: hypothetical protein VG936_04320 [Lacunisphaera sp.]|nr:hypothetical protein [Lacunisphaera sp.]
MPPPSVQNRHQKQYMGLRVNEFRRLLVHLDETGIPDSAITIGRMDIFLNANSIENICKHHGLPIPPKDGHLYSSKRAFLDNFLRDINVRRVDMVDYSDFEGANIIHNLSIPMGPIANSYQLVYESGTLEHIFDFPTALENVLRLCAIGGYVVLNMPCNNQAGHGFFQFSPELFFSIFRESSLFSLESVEVYEDFDESQRFSVWDPKLCNHRVEVRSVLPVNMTIVLKRTNIAEGNNILPANVIQADYASAWSKRTVLGSQTASRGRVWTQSLQQRRKLMLKIDSVLLGFVRWLISIRRRQYYLGSMRRDLTEVE